MERRRQRGFKLLGLRFLTPHLARFGAVEISRREYERRLATALALVVSRRFGEAP